MLRKAEEILLTYYTREMSEPYGRVPFDVIIKSINEGRKEAIQECQEIAHEQGILGKPEEIEPNIKKLIKELK